MKSRTQHSPSADVGTALTVALAARDFPRLAGTLTPEACLRALTPRGLVETSGADAIAGKFASWFDDAEELELLHSECETFADRLHVSYRLRVRKPGGPPRLVEQHLLCALDGDRICSLDLVCTGFRPEGAWLTGRCLPIAAR